MMGQALAVRSSSSVISFAGRMKLKRGHCRPSLSNQGTSQLLCSVMPSGRPGQSQGWSGSAEVAGWPH